jgi:hypothetical protein
MNPPLMVVPPAVPPEMTTSTPPLMTIELLAVPPASTIWTPPLLTLVELVRP